MFGRISNHKCTECQSSHAQPAMAKRATIRTAICRAYNALTASIREHLASSAPIVRDKATRIALRVFPEGVASVKRSRRPSFGRGRRLSHAHPVRVRESANAATARGLAEFPVFAAQNAADKLPMARTSVPAAAIPKHVSDALVLVGFTVRIAPSAGGEAPSFLFAAPAGTTHLA